MGSSLTHKSFYLIFRWVSFRKNSLVMSWYQESIRLYFTPSPVSFETVFCSHLIIFRFYTSIGTFYTLTNDCRVSSLLKLNSITLSLILQNVKIMRKLSCNTFSCYLIFRISKVSPFSITIVSQFNNFLLKFFYTFEQERETLFLNSTHKKFLHSFFASF